MPGKSYNVYTVVLLFSVDAEREFGTNELVCQVVALDKGGATVKAKKTVPLRMLKHLKSTEVYNH